MKWMKNCGKCGVDLEMSKKGTFESFASEAIRGPRKGIYEHLLCQHLIAAVSSHPLRKIRLVCEAILMLPDPKSAGIDMSEVDIMYKVTRAFQQTSHNKYAGARFCYIPWPFEDSEENFKKYIAAWQQNVELRYYPLIWSFVSPSERRKYVEERNRIEEAVREMPRWKEVMWMTRKGQLQELSFDSLVSQFTAWALPKIQTVFVKAAKQINPTLYQEILHSINQQSKKLTAEEQKT